MKQKTIVGTDKAPLTRDGISSATGQLLSLIRKLESDGGTIKGLFWDQRRGSETGQFIIKAEREVAV